MISVVGGVSVLKWMDMKPVHLITTKMDPREMQEVTSRSGRRNKTVAVQDYIHNIAGVDKNEQLMAYMPLRRKTVKWWKKTFLPFVYTLSDSGTHSAWQISQWGAAQVFSQEVWDGCG